MAALAEIFARVRLRRADGRARRRSLARADRGQSVSGGRGRSQPSARELPLRHAERGRLGAALDPGRSPPDEFVVADAEIYLRLPNGVARSKLTNAWFDSRLGVVSTTRNWRTVARLAALIDARRG
jgi:hypothetical protein